MNAMNDKETSSFYKGSAWKINITAYRSGLKTVDDENEEFQREKNLNA